MQSSSETIASAIEALEGFAKRKEVGDAIRDELIDMVEQISPIQKRLTEIEGLYAIDWGSGIDEKIEGAASLWTNTEPGAVKGLKLTEVRSSSPLLSELFLSGLDIECAYRFGKMEDELAAWFGSHINTLSGLLHAFRREKKSEKQEGEWSILVENSHDLGDALNFLARHGVVKGKKLLTKNKAGRWVPFKFEWFRDDPNQNILIVYEKTDPALFHILQGRWMNSYVSQIIDNQLKRHEIPFELYTEVVYKAPADVIRGASDLDVVGRVRDTIVCVECKSGRLEQKYGHFDQITQRTEDLQKVISSMGAGDIKFLFFLVYDELLNSEENVNEALKEHEIKPLKLNEVRSVMAQTLSEAI